jgi:hypothetical protein
MDIIIKNLSDPSWWFTAFFVAIVASVIAGFLKDRTERFLGGASARYQQWRASEIEARAQILKALVAEPNYLSIAFHRATIGLLLWVVSMLLFLSTPILLAVTPAQDDTLMWLGQRDMVRKILMPVMGLFSVVVGFRGTSRLSVAFEALKLFRVKHGLPKLP